MKTFYFYEYSKSNTTDRYTPSFLCKAQATSKEAVKRHYNKPGYVRTVREVYTGDQFVERFSASQIVKAFNVGVIQ